jgi:hypothetical protein
MTCRTAWAGEQLHDIEAGTPVAAAWHALGAVPWRHHPSPLGSPFNSGAPNPFFAITQKSSP